MYLSIGCDELNNASLGGSLANLFITCYTHSVEIDAARRVFQHRAARGAIKSSSIHAA